MSKTKDKKFAIDQSRNRYFSESFKREKVKELLSKKVSVGELSKLYEVSRTSIYKWLYLYSNLSQGTKTVVQMESESSKTSYYKQKLSELERLYGQKQIEIDYLNKCFELASEDLGFDVKKKYGLPPLSGSARKEKQGDTK